MTGYQYRAKRHPMVALTITPEQEARIVAELDWKPRKRTTTLKPSKALVVNAVPVKQPAHLVRAPHELKPCGTHAAYYRHLRHKETACAPCRKAHNTYTEVKRKPRPQRQLNPCGTSAAYKRHLRHNEMPCTECRAANRRVA